MPLILIFLTLLQAGPQAPAAPQKPEAPASEATKAFEEANALFQKTENDKALAAYDRAIALDATNPEFHIGRGRTLQRLRKFDDALAAFTQALRLRPEHAMALRYRGHAYINIARFEPALADLTKAESLKKDDYGIYYHLALAHYLSGHFNEAAKAYEGCVRTSASDENLVACSAWQYPSLRRAGRDAEAQKVLDRITPAMEVKESLAYLDRLLLFKGEKTEEEVAAAMAKGSLEIATVGYGVGLWHLLNGREAHARAYFQKALTSDYTPAFGYVASKVELERMK